MALPIRRVEAPRKRVSYQRRLARGATPTGTAASVNPRAELRLVPQRRTAANAVILLVAVIAGLMLAAVVLHTRLADRQLEIDAIEAEVVEARERFDVLRQQRAELRSPNRLAIASGELGMYSAVQTEFIEVDSETLAQVLAAAGTIDESTGRVDPAEPLEQIQRVRAAGEP